jgi:hypothetical protein
MVLFSFAEARGSACEKRRKKNELLRREDLRPSLPWLSRRSPAVAQCFFSATDGRRRRHPLCSPRARSPVLDVQNFHLRGYDREMRMSKKERDWIRTREKRIVFKRRKPDYS